jgi:hypothetical protein
MYSPKVDVFEESDDKKSEAVEWRRSWGCLGWSVRSAELISVYALILASREQTSGHVEIVKRKSLKGVTSHYCGRGREAVN